MSDDFEVYGDIDVAVYVPSRRNDGSAIDDETIDTEVQMVITKLSQIFFGSTAPAYQPSVGGYQHRDGRIIGESVQRIFTKVKTDSLNDANKEAVIQLAKKVALDFNQEAVAIEWGRELCGVAGTYSKTQGGVKPFSACGENFQKKLVWIVLSRLRGHSDVANLLSLDSWKDVEKQEEFSGFQSIFTIARKKQSTALFSEKELNFHERSSLSKQLKDKDLVFDRTIDGIRVWYCLRSQLRGGRKLPFVKDGKVSRVAMEIALALLNSQYTEKLEDIIDKSALTSKFYRQYRGLRETIAREYGTRNLNKKEAEKAAQKLLGRLLFLKFFERKNWLKARHNYLENLFNVNQKGFYRKV